MRSRVQNAEPFEFAAHIKEELRTRPEKERQVSLLYALYRALESVPERRQEALAALDAIRRRLPSDHDAAWESWRASFAREPVAMLSALTELTAFLEFPGDILHAHLFAAEIQSERLGDAERALKEIDAIRKIAPKLEEVRLASARTRAFAGGSVQEILEDLACYADLLNDDTAAAAVRFETAEAMRLAGQDPRSVHDLLDLALSAPDPDWTVLDGVLRCAENIEAWDLAARAVEAMAEAALEASEYETPEKPVGHKFRGFVRGEDHACAYYWYLSQILERRLKDVEKALIAVEKALALMPRNRLFKLERARLLSALERQEDAFSAIPEDAAFIELAHAALVAGKHEDAVYLASLERESTHSLFAEILLDSLNEEIPPPPPDAPAARLQLWFDSRPDEKETAAVAEALRPHTDIGSVAWLYLEEHAATDKPITDIIDKRRPDPWSYALSAVMGQGKERVDAFVQWAETTVDPILKSALLRVALRHAEDGLDEVADVDWLIEQIESVDAECQDADAHFEPSPDNWRFQVTASTKPSGVAEIEPATSVTIDLVSPDLRLDPSSPSQTTAAYLRALILSQSLGDFAAADETLAMLEKVFDSDPFVLLLRADIAAKQGNTRDAAKCLMRLVTRANADAGAMYLAQGELLLALHQDLDVALGFLDSAEKEGGETAVTARVLRLLALHLLGEQEAILRAIEESAAAAKSGIDSFFTFEDPRDDGFDSALVLEGQEELPVYSKMLAVLHAFEDRNSSPNAAAENAAALLSEVGDMLSSPAHAQAFRVAASLLNPQMNPSVENETGLDETDALLSCLEVGARADGKGDKVANHLKEAEKVQKADVFEWVDWMLRAAEAAESQYGPKAALDIVHEALAAAPEHPGLLEAEVRFAYASGAYEEAADTHGRLARFYISRDEKVHQLAQAALILLDKLQNPEGARNIINEAKRRNPGHAEANDVLRHILRAVGETGVDAREDDDSAIQRLAAIEAEEKEISDLVKAGKWKEAMGAVNGLLFRAPDRPFVHRTRLDLLTREKRWEEAVAAAEGYFNTASNKEERRSIVFRAASIAQDVLKDPRLAVAWLLRLKEVGDTFLEAENRILEIARKAGFEDEALEILSASSGSVNPAPDGGVE